MATLIKRNQTWYARYWHDGKDRWKALSPSKIIAQQKILDLEKIIRSKRYGDPLEEREIDWPEFTEKYLAYCKSNMRPTTVVRAEVVLSNFRKAVSIHRLSEITPELVEGYKAIRKAAGIQGSTINREIVVLRCAVNLGKQWGYRTSSLGAIKKMPVVKKHPVFFTTEEIQTMLQKADPFWKTLIYLGYYAGLRMGEMLNLDWADVDFERHQLRISPKEDWSPKDAEPREIYLHLTLEEHLKVWCAVSQPHVRVLPWERRTNQMSNMFKNFLKRCGITKGSLHTLRHSFAYVVSLVMWCLCRCSCRVLAFVVKGMSFIPVSRTPKKFMPAVPMS